MAVLIIGLLLFLGSHSVRIFADNWRKARIEQIGEKRWKGAYSLVSIVGFALIIWGYGLARHTPALVWSPPGWAMPIAGVLTLAAFILLPAAYVPGTDIKARVKHPMTIAVALWALGHLLANGTLNAVVLFGAFFVWALADVAAARKRDRAQGTVYPAGTHSRDAIAVVVGIVAWVVFAFYLHGVLIGVEPMA